MYNDPLSCNRNVRRTMGDIFLSTVLLFDWFPRGEDSDLFIGERIFFLLKYHVALHLLFTMRKWLKMGIMSILLTFGSFDAKGDLLTYCLLCRSACGSAAKDIYISISLCPGHIFGRNARVLLHDSSPRDLGPSSSSFFHQLSSIWLFLEMFLCFLLWTSLSHPYLLWRRMFSVWFLWHF